jgi:hypothetical protein
MMPRIPAPWLALLCCAALAVALAVSSRALGATLPSGDQPNRALTPPPNGGQPVEVQVGLYVTNLAQIDEVLERFYIKGTLFARWRDPRLAAKPGENVDQLRLFKPGEIWQPDLEMVNAVTPREQHDVTITVDHGGMVDYAEVFAATLSTLLRLQPFPFDSQSLTTIIRPFAAPTSR